MHEIFNNVVCGTSKGSDQPAHTRSLIRAFARRLNILSVKLLAEHLLEILSLKGGCTGSYESTLVKMPHCWKLCADPEGFVREDPNLIRVFCLYFSCLEDRGSKYHYKWAIIGPPAKC